MSKEYFWNKMQAGSYKLELGSWMADKKYGNWRYSKFPSDWHIMDERTIEFEGNKVIVVEKYNKKHEHVLLIPGYELSKKEGVSKVMPIEKDKRKELESMLDFDGKIEYW